MKSALFFVCCAVVSSVSISSEAQQKAGTTLHKRASAAVSGRVFLVTEAGDIKPARFAHVCLLYLWSGVPQKDPNAPSPTTAGTVFLNKQNDGISQEIEEMKDPNTPTDDGYQCKRRLLTARKALTATLDWAEESKKVEQIIIGDTDEEGIFHLSGVPQGRYTVIALGRAGANEAFWEAEVFARAGEAVAVKLHSPETSCLSLP